MASAALEVFHNAGCDDDLARARHAVESQSRTLLVLGDAPSLVCWPDEAHYRQWFATLVAPNKPLATFDNSGHNPHLDEPGQLLESHRTPEVTVAWQGGEPTLMGLDFFRRAMDLVAELARPDEHHVDRPMRVMAAALRSGGDAHVVMDWYRRGDERPATRPEPVP